MPVVISPSLQPNIDALDFPLTHARIGYRSFVADGELSASSSAAGFPVSALTNSMTYERWQPAEMPADLTIDAQAAADADYIGIASHTLGSSGATISIEYSDDNEAWTEIESIEPASDDALMVLFESVTARYWRLSISGDGAPQIGVVYIGEVMAMQRPIYGGHSPSKLSRNTATRPNISEGGQYLGRSIIRRGYQGSYQWENLKAGWYRAVFDPFVEAARTQPFFIAWRPETFPSEVLYAWTDGDISPSNSGIRNLMSVGFSVQGLG